MSCSIQCIHIVYVTLLIYLVAISAVKPTLMPEITREERTPEISYDVFITSISLLIITVNLSPSVHVRVRDRKRERELEREREREHLRSSVLLL